jgi:hypothetical protein
LEQDVEAVQAISSDMRSFGAGMTELGKALESENLEGARERLGQTTATLQEARAKALDLDNGDFQATLQDYVRGLTTITDAYDRWISYFEDDSTPGDQALEDRMLSDIQKALRHAQAADEDFLNRILNNASPEQRDAIRNAVRDYQGGQAARPCRRTA